jgi:Cu/Ag efflux pump CusA
MKEPSGCAARWRRAPALFRHRLANKARLVLANFPEVKQVVSQVGRPDDGSDASGFYNTEFFVDLLPRENGGRNITRKMI